jgi:hypothetical protein
LPHAKITKSFDGQFRQVRFVTNLHGANCVCAVKHRIIFEVWLESGYKRSRLFVDLCCGLDTPRWQFDIALNNRGPKSVFQF